MSNNQLKALKTMLDMANDTGHKIVWTPDGELHGGNQIELIQGTHVKLKNSKVLDARDMRSDSFSTVHVTPIVVLELLP